MHKLLDKWLFEPNLANAQKVVNYDKKHPMASCMLTKDLTLLLNKAKKCVADNTK